MGWFARCCGQDTGPIDCPVCDPGTTPITVSVTIPGLSNGSCTNCANLAGTYVLDNVGECLYEREFTVSLGACGTVTFKLTYTYGISFGIETRNLYLYEGTDYTRWIYNGGYHGDGVYDCTGTKTLPWVDGSGSGKCAYNTTPGSASMTPNY